MLVSVHQPHYLPWLRYLESIARSELFIVLDDADFNRNGWQNRNKIKGRQGALTLTVPVHQKSRMRIHDVAVTREPWARKHWATLTQAYAAAPHLADYREALASFYTRDWPLLVDLACEMLRWHADVLKIPTPVVRSSTLVPPRSEGVNASERLVELVRAVGGTGYLTGAFALEAYLDPNVFQKAGLDLYTFHWSAPTYRQIHPAVGFVPDLATLDLLLCEGEGAREILASGARVERYAV